MGVKSGKKVRGRRGTATPERTELVTVTEQLPVEEKLCINAKMQLLTHHQEDGVSM